ncbi:uncharacterized protein CANTADRAFT_239028 [Suhomyces tanzawaensis NRRL Y-17324]|uniref:Uncharacterized protein n=1 Tax=Suhomyces tanzawaensis NRRL Y-17324 TaxID=984487 RepID=A0A1E4SHC1_9ASCO|nr:uncharacterized protein CANTADRAFT_239028 [Suhomyces tanzawaensis NRRL Y-17324]ODV78903.1 hypothetical protein CANTADRAFT_239028 [Suhomyces tanzawaensis NRRL Y-17324]
MVGRGARFFLFFLAQRGTRTKHPIHPDCGVCNCTSNFIVESSRASRVADGGWQVAWLRISPCLGRAIPVKPRRGLCHAANQFGPPNSRLVARVGLSDQSIGINLGTPDIFRANCLSQYINSLIPEHFFFLFRTTYHKR